MELRRRGAEAFMEICLNPPAEWIGPVVNARFEWHGGGKRSDSDTYRVNEVWRPFVTTVPKRDRKIASESMAALPSTAYKTSQGSQAALRSRLITVPMVA